MSERVSLQYLNSCLKYILRVLQAKYKLVTRSTKPIGIRGIFFTVVDVELCLFITSVFFKKFFVLWLCSIEESKTGMSSWAKGLGLCDWQVVKVNLCAHLSERSVKITSCRLTPPGFLVWSCAWVAVCVELFMFSLYPCGFLWVLHFLSHTLKTCNYIDWLYEFGSTGMYSC